MDYLIWWMTLFLIGSCQISGNKEMLDFLVVYRASFESPAPGIYKEKIKEYHRWGNTKDMLLKNHDEYIDSVEGMAPLHCAPATSACQWNLTGSWGVDLVNTIADQNFTIDIGNEVEQEKNRCLKYDCKFIFFENGRPKCYCPNITSVHQQPSDNAFPVGPEYKIITTPVLLEDVGSTAKRWLVFPPKNGKTFVSASASPYYSQYFNVFVNEILGRNQKKQVFQLYDRSYSRSANLVSNHLLEIFRSGARTSIDISFKREHLVLNENHGSLSYKIFPVSERICVSVIYSQPKGIGDIKFNIMFSNGTKYEEPIYTERQFGEWKIRSFKSSLGKMTNDKINLQLDVSGKGTILHSIFGCNPSGQRDVTVMENEVSIPVPVMQLQEFKDSSGKCLNGGVYIAEAEMCICPEGFTGKSCEEGCGPYFFGPNCSSECSNFATGCSGMIFCKKNISCHCAAGFQGRFCEKECASGYYGASCSQKCGHCKNDQCDKFTGYCHNGCEPGFGRPFCHIPYKNSKIPPLVTYQDMNVVTVEINADEVEGIGEREYYQFQYREDKLQNLFWTELQPQKLRDIVIKSNISDLLPGVDYRVRVIYIDKDGNSYQQSKVPTTLFSTLCKVPTSVNYNLTATSTSSSIKLYWKEYDSNNNLCPVTGYTIVLQRNWNKVQFNVSRHDRIFSIGMLLPGVSYEVKIKAITAFGDGPFSRPLSVNTSDEAPLHVTNLQVTEGHSTRLRVSWKPPKFTGGSLQNFLIKYQCIRLLACEESCLEDTHEISVSGNQNYVDLAALRPHAQYFIEVAARSWVPGPYTSIEATTHAAAPVAAPEMSETPILTSTNASISVQWLPLKSCIFLNGYLVGYGYTLYSENGTVLVTGNTKNTHIAFDYLTPQTSYFVHVRAISSGGWNEDKKLIINASTAATVPDEVQNLSIYKRGRREIGVRWDQPVNTYGELESFSISYCRSNDCKSAVTIQVPPAPCVPWPELFCQSISNLTPNTQYSVSVRARNILVNDYGAAITVNTVTSEGVPEAPSSLVVSARTSDSITLEWGPPFVFNGILRSFLINVEHLDSANSSYCCVYSPLQEVPVKSEDGTYKREVIGLIPASKYIIGVSAKTISIGPSAFITLSTSPEKPELNRAPKLIGNNRVKLPLGEGFPGINGTYLLMVLLPKGNSTSQIWNSEVDKKLCSLVPTRSFYVVEEYNAEVLMSTPEEETEYLEVEIGQGRGPRNGTTGVLEDPILPSDFRVGLALVLDYNGAVSVGFISAEEAVKSDSETEDDFA